MHDYGTIDGGIHIYSCVYCKPIIVNFMKMCIHTVSRGPEFSSTGVSA